MGVINIENLRSGMYLERDVRDRNGRMLLGAGLTLTESHLRILKIWGVTEAHVRGVSNEDVEEQALAEVDPEVLAAAEAAVEERFIHTDPEHDFIRELKRMALKQAVRDALRNDPLFRPMPASPATDAAIPEPSAVNPQVLIRRETALGSLPMVFRRLVEVVNDSRSSASDVAEIISNDTDLSARLLKVVNSPFYGLGSRIDTISRAVAVVGSNQLVALAMGITAIDTFKGIPRELVDMASFWRHSIACGIAARLLASHTRTSNTERFFVAGLLHDIGRLTIFKLLPDSGRAMIQRAARDKAVLTDVETGTLGFAHDELGGMLLKQWKLPVSLEMNVRYHHEPARAGNPLEASIICLADLLANGVAQGSSGERFVPPMPEGTWEAVGLPVSVVPQIVRQMEYQVDEILGFFTNEG